MMRDDVAFKSMSHGSLRSTLHPNLGHYDVTLFILETFVKMLNFYYFFVLNSKIVEMGEGMANVEYRIRFLYFSFCEYALIVCIMYTATPIQGL